MFLAGFTMSNSLFLTGSFALLLFGRLPIRINQSLIFGVGTFLFLI